MASFGRSPSGGEVQQWETTVDEYEIRSKSMRLLMIVVLARLEGKDNEHSESHCSSWIRTHWDK